jgi:CDGSH-type Zn-finger protein/uncharacterized Fe-S cluster protein YjdI
MLAPSPQDYASQGHLYHGVLQGLARLVEQLGEEQVFVGHGQAQVCMDEYGLPGLFKIDDLAAARRAVEQVVTQGEGAPAHRDDSHFARFAAIRQELAALRAARPGFEPSRPVARNPVLGAVAVAPDCLRVTEPRAARVVDLGNSIYALTIRVLSQVFAPAPLPGDLRVGLAASTTALMSVLGRLADAATRLPVDPARPGLTGGPNFELPGSSGQLVQQCAARILGERAAELAGAARQLTRQVPLAGIADDLDALAQRFEGLHLRFEVPLGEAVDRVARLAPPPAASPPAPPAAAAGAGAGAELPRVRADGGAPDVVCSEGITIRFDGGRCIHARHCVLEAPTVFMANTPGRWIHPESAPVEHCVRVAERCPSGAITYERHDGGAQEAAPSVNVVRVRENGPYAVHAQVASPVVAGFRATLCRCGKSRRKPACDGSHAAAGFTATGEPATRASEPLADRAGPLAIDPVRNGPLVLSGNVEICSGTGRTVWRTQSARLCRCGASENKPFCDGSHARVGFVSEP